MYQGYLLLKDQCVDNHFYQFAFCFIKLHVVFTQNSDTEVVGMYTDF